MSDGGNAEFDLDALMRRIREEVARRKTAAGLSSAAADPAPARSAPAGAAPRKETIALPRLPESRGSIARKDRYELADFLAFQDEDFVRNAYRGILRREADFDGFAAFLEALRHGRLAKADLLGRMRFSTEGRAAGVPVRGLPLAFALRSACRVPVLGRVFGIVLYLFRLPDIVRNHEQLEATFFHRQLELHQQINATRASIDRLRAEMATSTQAAELERSVVALAGAAATRDEVATKFVAVERALALKADATEFVAVERALAFKADATEFGNVVGSVRELERRLAVLLEEARRKYRADAPGAEPVALMQEDEHLFDAFYAAFENRFRGTPEDIRQRVAVYLPVIREARAGTANAPVLDIGCGRGEWLELLKENGLAAGGVDLNRVTVAKCRAQGLAVSEGDAVEYLRGLKADSLGAVTAMHVIEHISFRQLVALFDEVLRVLQPGGVAVFETPNPENLIVGACNFYYDPTHERPLPPEPTRFIAESRGFVDVSILRLHPVPEILQLADGAPAVRELINRLLYGAQDYALIARKPKR